MRSNTKVGGKKKSIKNSASKTEILDRNEHSVEIKIANSGGNKGRKLAENLDLNTKSSDQDSSSLEDVVVHNDLWMLKYNINDNFLDYWFRFIFHNRSAVETGNYSYIREIIDRDYATWAGLKLERFFHELFAESGNYNIIGSYWEKGNQNEIDLVAVNDLKKKLTVAEIKMNKTRINLDALKRKGDKLLESYQGYEVTWLALELEDAADYL